MSALIEKATIMTRWCLGMKPIMKLIKALNDEKFSNQQYFTLESKGFDFKKLTWIIKEIHGFILWRKKKIKIRFKVLKNDDHQVTDCMRLRRFNWSQHYMSKMRKYKRANYKWSLTMIVANFNISQKLYPRLPKILTELFYCFQRPFLAVRKGPFKAYLLKYVPTLEVKYWPTFWCFESRAQTVSEGKITVGKFI